MNIVLGLIAFSSLILVHELGHFVLAKLNGVMVEEFSLGMGPKVFSIQGKETRYSFRLFLIGGFVKMLGDDNKSDDPRAFNNKHPLRKLSVVAAGPIMNILFAILLFGISSSRGFYIPSIGTVQNDTPAQIAGLMPEDIITKFNGIKLTTWDDLMVVMSVNKNDPINLTIKRKNEIKEFLITPTYNEAEKRYLVGIGGGEVFKKPTFYEAASYGINETSLMIKLTGSFFKTLFEGKASMDNVGGPVTVVRLTGEVAKAGIYPLISFAAYISIQLGLFNLIPFPALDGGYIFLYIYQVITRKEVNDNAIGFINRIGLILLMTLMVLVIIKDILYPLKL